VSLNLKRQIDEIEQSKLPLQAPQMLQSQAGRTTGRMEDGGRAPLGLEACRAAGSRRW
jgi:hypothetical protein